MIANKLRKRSNLSYLSSVAALGAISLLTACNLALVEAPYYNVTEVQSFKVSGAPSQVMMLEIVDANDTLEDQVWATAMSNHGYPPRLTFVTDATDIADNQTIKPENRVVAVVNPTQATMRDRLCTSPQSAKMDGTADRIIVRFGFCVGDDIISETRARFTKDQFEEQLFSNADTLSYQLFPRHIRKNDDRHCPPTFTVC